MPALQFKIAGLVQGVGFRYAMCKEARRLRLVGWVRNCNDGSVEAVQSATIRLCTASRVGERGPAAPA